MAGRIDKVETERPQSARWIANRPGRQGQAADPNEVPGEPGWTRIVEPPTAPAGSTTTPTSRSRSIGRRHGAGLARASGSLPGWRCSICSRSTAGASASWKARQVAVHQALREGRQCAWRWSGRRPAKMDRRAALALPDHRGEGEQGGRQRRPSRRPAPEPASPAAASSRPQGPARMTDIRLFRLNRLKRRRDRRTNRHHREVPADHVSSVISTPSRRRFLATESPSTAGASTRWGSTRTTRR